MTAPANEDLREIARELVIAAESGEARSFAELREHFGLGHEDLEGALDMLREHGKAVEVAPGEWRGPLMDELPQDDPPRVRVSVGEDDSEPAPTEMALTRPPPMSPYEAGTLVLGDANVRLTRAIADALDADALGQIVKAGLAGVDTQEPFTLEVLPSQRSSHGEPW